jgi:hypothetical protein
MASGRATLTGKAVSGSRAGGKISQRGAKDLRYRYRYLGHNAVGIFECFQLDSDSNTDPENPRISPRFAG